MLGVGLVDAVDASFGVRPSSEALRLGNLGEVVAWRRMEVSFREVVEMGRGGWRAPWGACC